MKSAGGGIAGVAITRVAITCMAAAGLLARPAPAADDAVRLERGRALYTESCMSCHGAGGAGDGPAAGATRVPTSDLTRIAERRGGVFPDAEVAEIIDGRRHLRAHGPRGMPIWGRAFGPAVSGGPDGAEARDRVRVLVEYLKSIQRPADEGPADEDPAD